MHLVFGDGHAAKPSMDRYLIAWLLRSTYGHTSQHCLLDFLTNLELLEKIIAPYPLHLRTAMNRTQTRARKARRSRWRSASPVDSTNKKGREYYLSQIAEFQAKERRRSRLALKERMAEDGQELLLEILGDRTMTLLLQPSPPRHMGRARCYAPDCLMEGTTAMYSGRIFSRLLFGENARPFIACSLTIWTRYSKL